MGRECRQDISLHVLLRPGQQVGVHGESGNEMSSISGPSKEGAPLCQTRTYGMEPLSVARAAEKGILLCLFFIPPFNLLLPNTCPEVPHEKRDEVAGTDTRWLAGTGGAWVCTSINPATVGSELGWP